MIYENLALMGDDPLAILQWMWLQLFKIKFVKRMIYVLLLLHTWVWLIHTYFIVSEFSLYFLNSYIILYSGTIFVISLCFSIIHIESSGKKYELLIRRCQLSYEGTSKDSKDKINKIANTAIIIGITFFQFTMLSIFFIIPFINPHVKEYYFMSWFLEKYFPYYSTPLKVFYYGSFFLVGCMSVATGHTLFYSISSLNIQYVILSDLIKHINFGYGAENDCELFYNEEYQQIVQNRLRFCITFHNKLKQRERASIDLTYLPVLLQFLSGLVFNFGLLNLYFTVQGTTLDSIIYLVPLATAISIAGCIYIGQNITDECEAIVDILYQCPWHTWNQSNKKTFLLLQLNTTRPFKLFVIQNLALNHSFAVFVMRMLYSMLAILSKINDRRIS